MPYTSNILSLIGNTPLVRLSSSASWPKATVLAKLEFFNPGGSVKDRMALYIIEDAEKTGQLKPGGTIVDNTSGNTGIAVALIASIKGYKTIFTCADKTSQEKVDLLKSLGAEVVITPSEVEADSPLSCYQTARRIAQETPGCFYLNQYDNPKNPEAHYHTTGPEIWKQTRGQIDYFVAGIGTGGTLSGVAKYLKEKNPLIRVIAVDPCGSVFTQYIKNGKPSTSKFYYLEGIGSDRLTGALNKEVIDWVIQVPDREAFLTSRQLARSEGLFVGGSSGAAVCACSQIARELKKKATIVTILPDTGLRYLSKLYSDKWMEEKGFLSGNSNKPPLPS